MKNIFKWWIALEIIKLLIIIVPLFIEINWVLWSTVMAIFLVTLTLISYLKILPIYKKINKLLFDRKGYTDVELLMKAKTNLFSIMICDLIPFIPVIQSVLRYLYYKNFNRLIIREFESEEFLSK